MMKHLQFALLALATVLPLNACGKGESPPPAAEAGMCAEHGVLEADCPWCHKELVEKLGECKEHGVPEALGWIC